MVFYEFLKGKYDFLAPHSENYNFTKLEIKWMKKMYKKVIVIFDYDLAGVMGANKLRKQDKDLFEVNFISTERLYINGKLKVVDKDISDFAFMRTKQEVINKLKTLSLI